jgi:hypothetical protein
LNEFEFKDVSHYDKLIDWNNMKKVYLKWLKLIKKTKDV